ncbi:MAG TPA: hypothetical protein VF655_00140 [Allosphingosinicella sp.]|jgi:hypothetical protein
MAGEAEVQELTQTETQTAETAGSSSEAETGTAAATEGAETATGGDEATALGKKPEAEGDEEGKEGADTGAASILGAPEAYEIKPPEGREFDQEVFDLVADDLKGMDLSNEGAQRIVDLYAEKVLPKVEERMLAQVQEQSQLATAQYRKDWLDAARADPEIGGAKWDESLHLAAKVFDTVGMKVSDPLRVLLEESGLGNHPDFIRYQRRVAQLIGEDRTEAGDGQPGGARTGALSLYSDEFQPKT